MIFNTTPYIFQRRFESTVIEAGFIPQAKLKARDPGRLWPYFLRKHQALEFGKYLHS